MYDSFATNGFVFFVSRIIKHLENLTCIYGNETRVEFRNVEGKYYHWLGSNLDPRHNPSIHHQEQQLIHGTRIEDDDPDDDTIYTQYHFNSSMTAGGG